MTRDIFSNAAIAPVSAEYRASQLHAIPTATPRGERSSRSFSHGSSGNEMSVVRIGEQLAPLAKCKPEGTRVQQRKRVTVSEAKRLIEALDEPWTSTNVARANHVSEETAYEWLARCAAKYGWVAERGRNGGFRRAK